MSGETFELIDTHQHLWDLSVHRYSWTAGIPPLNRGFVYSDYLAAAKELPLGLRLTRTVHVEADPDDAFVDAEAGWLSALAAQPKSLISGIVAGCRPESADFASRIDHLLSTYPRVRGFRRVLHTQPDELSRGTAFRRNVGSLSKVGATFDLCVLARQLPLAIELARACPDTAFVLDHCGVPDVKAQALDPWREHITALAECPNVVACKVSGLVAYADPSSWSAETLRPFTDHVFERFGPDRLMFGSDWPVCTLTCSYGEWARVLLELTSGWSRADRSALFCETARRVYRLGAQG